MSSRSKGLEKERVLRRILTGLGYKVQKAPPKVRFAGGDLFGCLDMIAIRKHSPPLFIQAGVQHHGWDKRRDIEKELLPYLSEGPGYPRVFLFLWGRTGKDGHRWAIDEYSDGAWHRFGTMSLGGTVKGSRAAFLTFEAKVLAEKVPELKEVR